MSKASATLKNLTTAQIAAWAGYAGTIVKHNPVTGKAYSPTTLAAFTALASRFLQVSPAGTIPVAPPTSAFAGDLITVAAGYRFVRQSTGQTTAMVALGVVTVA